MVPEIVRRIALKTAYLENPTETVDCPDHMIVVRIEDSADSAVFDLPINQSMFVRITFYNQWHEAHSVAIVGGKVLRAHQWRYTDDLWTYVGQSRGYRDPDCEWPNDIKNAKPKAERALDRLHLLIPRRHREEILGDLHEDIAAMRKNGCHEKLLCRYIYLQVFYAVAERLKPWNWLKGGAFLWFVHKIIG